MSHTRRRFLGQAGRAVALAPIVPVGRLAALHGKGAAAGVSEDAGAPRRKTPAQDAWVARARAQIPASTGSVYMQTGGIGPSPVEVIDEVKERLDFQNQGPAHPDYAT